MDAWGGEDLSSCGSLHSPCKTLRMGVEQVGANGTVYINGTQSVNSTINIDKNIAIHGLNGASIIIPLLSSHYEKVFHVFKVVSQVDARFMFLNLPLMALKITSSSSITILNSTFIGARRGETPTSSKGSPSIYIPSVYQSRIMVSITLKGVIFTNTDNPLYVGRPAVLSALSIIDSSFNNTGEITAYDCGKATLTRTNFHKVGRIEIKVIESATIRHCQFVATESLNLLEAWVSGRRFPEAEAFISNSQFRKIPQGIAISGFNYTTIFKCVVASCLEFEFKTSSVALQANHIIVDELFCDHNEAVGGGCMALRQFNFLYLKNSVFKENKAKKNGGALIIDCNGKGNAYEVISEIKNCSFVANEASKGGAIYISTNKNNFNRRDVDILVTNSEFTGNSASAKGGWGGCLSADGNRDRSSEIIRFYNCTFSNNSANSFGGVMALSEISLLVISSAIKNNRASFGGSGVDISSESNVSMTISKSSFIQNKPPAINAAVARNNLEDTVLRKIAPSGYPYTNITDP